MTGDDVSPSTRGTGTVRPAPETEVGYRRVLLVGIMGAGKTSVGRELARMLEWRFSDLDRLVEAEYGLSVADLFAQRGEAVFRRAEARIASRELARDAIVIAPGGGWAVQDDARITTLPPATLSVWLRASPEVAARRLSDSAGQHSRDPGRPLLSPAHRVRTLAHMTTERTPYYARAHTTVDTDGLEVSAVAQQVYSLVVRERHPTPSPYHPTTLAR